MENIKKKKTGVKKSSGRSWLITLFVTLTALDIVIVVDLIRRLIQTNIPLVWAISFFLVFILDILPIFILAPIVNKIANGIITKEDRNYNLQFITIIGIVALFVLAVAFYSTASIVEAERFLVKNESNLFGASSGFANFIAERETLAEVVNDNYMTAAILVGVLPVISTLLSFMLNFVSIGRKYLNDQLRDFMDRKENTEQAIMQIDNSNKCLIELKRIIGLINSSIADFNQKLEFTLNINAKNEEEELNFANAQIKENLCAKLNAFENSVRSILEEYDPKKIPSWTVACNEIREDINGKIQEIEKQYL